MKTLTFRPFAGDHISSTAEQAIILAKKHNRRVYFRFNGITIRAKRNSRVEELANAYSHAQDRAREIWKNSDAGIRFQNEQQIERWENIQWAAIVIGKLPDVLQQNSMGSLMKWVIDFVPAQDWVYVDYDKSNVAKQLLDAGYVTNEHVGKPPEFFNNRENMGRYIIGQLLDGLLNHGVIAPITATFAERYFEVPS